MSNTNRNMTRRELDLELERLNCKLAEIKRNFIKKKESNDLLEAAVNSFGWSLQAINQNVAKATNLHNELIDGYEMTQNKLNAAIEKTEKNQAKANEEQIAASREKESKILDDKIAEAEREKMELMAKLGQLDMNGAKSKKEVEDLGADIKMLQTEAEASLRAVPGATEEKKSKKEKSVPTSEIDDSQGNLTQSDERLMDIQGIEQASFLDRYFLEAANIKQEPVTE